MPQVYHVLVRVGGSGAQQQKAKGLLVLIIMATTSLDAEKAMAPYSSTLAWKIPWMEESGRLQSMGLRRVGHN